MWPPHLFTLCCGPLFLGRYLTYLGDILKLVAAEVQCVEQGEEGELRERVDLVGVEDEATKAGAAKDRRERREGVS